MRLAILARIGHMLGLLLRCPHRGLLGWRGAVLLMLAAGLVDDDHPDERREHDAANDGDDDDARGGALVAE